MAPVWDMRANRAPEAKKALDLSSWGSSAVLPCCRVQVNHIGIARFVAVAEGWSERKSMFPNWFREFEAFGR